MFKTVVAGFMIVAWLSMSGAMAQAVSKQELLFRKAMIPLPDPTEEQLGRRMLESGVVVRAYVKSGHISRRPDLRADYVDLRRFRKSAALYGHRLVALEEEYLVTYIGCCVNPGFGAVIEQNGDMTELAAAATENKCPINFIEGPESIMADLKIKPKPGKTYHHIRCRANDIFAKE